MDAPLPTDLDFNVEQPISTDIALYGGVFVKRHVIPKAGTLVPQHSHTYDHLSLLTAGSMRVWCDDAYVGDFAAPSEIRIAAHTKHAFQALADGTTFCCVHNADHFEVEDEHELPGYLKPGTPDRGDGIEFATMTLDDFLAGDASLFEAHCISVGERADEWQDKNWALMRRIEAQGGLQMMTARRDGVLLGYSMAIVAPMLNSLDETEALHTLFYTSPAVPGLGVRLLRASVERLTGNGVTYALFRAGHRGHGPRLSAVYQRLGATPCGSMFMLKLQGDG